METGSQLQTSILKVRPAGNLLKLFGQKLPRDGMWSLTMFDTFYVFAVAFLPFTGWAGA